MSIPAGVHRSIPRIGAGLAAAIAIALLPGSAHAWRLNWFVELGIEHNDNVLLSETDPVSQNVVRPALGFELVQQGATVQAQVGGLLSYRDYLGDAYGSEFLGELNGTVNWVMVPERLHFTVYDRMSTLPINQTAPDAPGNRQQTNVFAAGPTLFFRFSPTLRGQAELRWIDSYAEETDGFNTSRIGAAVRAIKELDPTRRLSFNIDAQAVSVDDNTLSPDYDRYNAYARYSHTLNRIDYAIDLGYSWLRFDGGDSRSSPLFRGELGWRVSERSRFDVSAARRYSDTAAALLEPVDPSDGGVPALPPIVIVGGDDAVSATPYKESSLELGYGYDGVRADFGITADIRKLDYVDSSDVFAADQTGRGVSATWSWLLRPTWTLSIDGRYERLRFDNSDIETETRLLAMWLRKQFTPRWSGRFGISRYERDSSLAGQSANQNIVYLAMTYTR